MSSGSDHQGYWPSDMLSDYKNIRLTVEGVSVSVAVNCYRNNGHALEKGGTQEAIVVKDALLRAGGAKTVLARCGGPQQYFAVFSGKGAPAAIAQVMLCFHEFAGKFIDQNKNGTGPGKKCAAWLADDNLSWQDTFQNISNAFLGLDCNGFVGNWMQQTEPTFKLGPQNGPKEFYSHRKHVRTTVDSIEYWDVVIWANFSHIAVIENTAGAGLPRFDMCQSAGGGPRLNEYAFAVSSPGKFRMTGGIPKSDVAGEVFVISHWE